MDTFELVALDEQEFRSPSTQTWVIRLSFPIPQYPPGGIPQKGPSGDLLSHVS